MNVTVNGLPVSVDVAGAGEPILFVHGFPLNRRMWQAQTTSLSDHFHVIAPDLRGFGAGQEVSPVVTMEEYADDLAALLDALDVREPVNLCGLSMGGYVAFAFFRRHRQRLRRLMLCDTKAVADTPEKKLDRERTADDVLKHGTAKIVQEIPGSLLCNETILTRPEIIRAVREIMAEISSAGVAAALRGMAVRRDSSDLLKHIDVPTLVLCGADDAVSPPAEMRSMAEMIPKAVFVQVPSAGHLSPVENPADVNDAIRDFLMRH
ncbi:MAG: alpha/beta hydrolase [Planctomycetota bacterium]|nr:alpha/beta fold hydrolase [Planctomycetaceae bacterium]MDQ3330027.1 alpha/beta hydrolase [Planctomycetota bacterium]